MKNSQRLKVQIENLTIETNYSCLDDNLKSIADKLYQQTAAWQAEGIGNPPWISHVIDGMCVSIHWIGNIPKIKPKITKIMGYDAESFMSKQYK